jgi:DHA1 family tetracycline resistance protein-like MFS transporter
MTQASEVAPELPNSPPKRALLTIFLIVFVDLLGFGLILPLLPFYARKFEASNTQVAVLFSVFSICQFVAAPILGVISDRFGRKPVLGFSQIGSVLGFLLMGFTTDHDWGARVAMGLTMLYLARVIDGLSGGNISTAQAYISDITTKENRARGMGLLGAAFGMGFVIGPGLSALLTHFINEAAPAYAAAGFSGIAAIMTFLWLPESRTHKHAEAEAWLHPRVFKPVLKRPVLLQLMSIWFLTMAAYVMVDCTIVLYLADVFHFNEAKTGLYFVYVGVIIAGVQGGLIRRLMKKTDEWVLSTLGPFMVAIGYLVTLTTMWHPWQTILILGGAIYASGRSIQQPTIQSLVSKASPPEEQGVTFGLFQGTGTIARVIGPIIAGPIYTAHYIGPFCVAGVIVTVASAWTWGLKQTSGASAIHGPLGTPVPSSGAPGEG